MAILKHIASKNANYGSAIDYLKYQHDEFHLVPVLDESGNMLLREELYLDGLNCHHETFDLECELLNQQYHKNNTYDEIKNMMKDEIINIIKGLWLSNARYKYLSSIIDFIEKYDNATWFCHLVLIYYKRYFCNKHNPENCPLRNHVEVKCKCRK